MSWYGHQICIAGTRFLQNWVKVDRFRAKIQYGETHKPLQTFSEPFWKNLPTRNVHKQGVVWPHRDSSLRTENSTVQKLLF